MEDCRYSRGRGVVLGGWLQLPIYPVENRTKSDFTARNLCVPLGPVDNQHHDGVFFERKMRDPK